MSPAIRRLLVPIDFSAGSDRATEYAAMLAGSLRASVHLLHVLEESFATYGPWEFKAHDTAARRERAVRSAQARLAAIAAGFAPAGVKIPFEVRSGQACREIVAVALDRGIDLILMGTDGRTGLAHAMYGSVAEHVIRKAPCAVLAVREPAARYAPPTAMSVAQVS
jgi:nucleotide-binding universal stress UspA family protein